MTNTAEPHFNPQKIVSTMVPKVPFRATSKLSEKFVKQSFDFAYHMAFGEGHHRNHRSGGSEDRNSQRIFINTLQGKLAEFAFYEHMKNNKSNHNIDLPDCSVKGVGHWDEGDFVINGKTTSIKSSSHYSNLLLLESKDYNREGCETKFNPPKKIDIFIMVRIAVDSNGQNMSLEKMLYQLIDNGNNDPRDFLEALSKSLKYEISGYITHNDFLKVIQDNFVLEKGELINHKTKMDARNYYVPVKALRNPVYLTQQKSPTPVVKVSAMIEKDDWLSIQDLNTLGLMASKESFLKLKLHSDGKGDDYTRMKFNQLKRIADKNILDRPELASFDESSQSKILRWTLRGLKPELAILKIKYDLETYIPDNIRRQNKDKLKIT